MHPTSALALAIVALNAANTVVGLPTGQENWRRSDIEDLVARHEKLAVGHVEGENPGIVRRDILETRNPKSPGPGALVDGGTAPGSVTIAGASGATGRVDPSLGGNRPNPGNREPNGGMPHGNSRKSRHLRSQEAVDTDGSPMRRGEGGIFHRHHHSSHPHGDEETDVGATGSAIKRRSKSPDNTESIHTAHHPIKADLYSGLSPLHGGHSPHLGDGNARHDGPGPESGIIGDSSALGAPPLETRGDSGASPVPGTPHGRFVRRDYDDDMESVD